MRKFLLSMNDLSIQQGCPNRACKSYGKNSDVTVHDKQLKRLRCRACGKTWSAHNWEFHFGLRTDTVKVRRAVDMLKAEIPIRKIARLIDVSAGTVMRWKKKLNEK
ncbi:MAG: hypothetical protein ABII02_01310 [Candidatus Magasanikbacteria bacterium]